MNKAKIMGTIGVAGATIGSALATYNATYTPSDMPNVATDVIGEAGVQLKVYVPIIILLALAGWGAKVVYGLKRRG